VARCQRLHLHIANVTFTVLSNDRNFWGLELG